MAVVGAPEPPPSPLRRAEAALRAALPGTATAALMMLASGPVGMPGLVSAVALPPVVIWSVLRPALMPPVAVFPLGLLLDLLTLAPLGAGVLTLLLAHGLAAHWRAGLRRAGFPAFWLAFCGFVAGAAALGYALTALLALRLPPLAPALHQAVLTAALHPPFALAIGWLHGAMLREEEAP